VLYTSYGFNHQSCQLFRRLSAGKIGLGLLRVLSREGMFVGGVDLRDALAHSIEEEFEVVGVLLGSDRVAHHYRTQELDVLLCEHEGREKWDGAGYLRRK